MVRIPPALLVLALTIPSASANEVTLSPRDFARHDKFSSVKISPDGRHLAVTFLTENGRKHLGILEILDTGLKGRANITLTGDRDVEDFYWASSERVIYNISEKSGSLDYPQYTGELFATNIDGTQHRIIFGFRAREGGNASRVQRRDSTFGHHSIVDTLPDDPEHVLIAVYPWSVRGGYWVEDTDKTPLLTELNVINGNLKTVDSLPTYFSDVIVDGRGNPRFAYSTEDFVTSTIYAHQPSGTGWTEFRNENIEGEWRPMHLEEDGVWLYLEKQANDNTIVLQRLNTQSDQLQTLFQTSQAEISDVIVAAGTEEIVAVATEAGKPAWMYVQDDHKLAQLHRGLLKAFPGHDVTIQSQTRDGNRLVIEVHSPRNAGDFYLVDTETRSARYLLSRRDWLPVEKLAVMEPVSFVAGDGFIIHGYLTMPDRPPGQKVPLVVYPHGGPHGVRDYWQYDSDVQFLAHNGYAVLQLNFRGSGGYGKAFERAGYGQWGNKMQDDISDATRWAVAQGVTDPDSICIYGASYGGYAALMGVATTDLYRCAVGYAGVYDLELMRKEGDIKDKTQGLKYLDAVIGTTPELLRKRSPVYLAENIKVPVLLIHGGRDERVPIIHAEELRKKLDEYDKPYEWLVEKREGHGFFDVDNRVKLYQTLLAFLNRHIGGK
jgi:dipeptidyl aminopeptidase/acylaminoacyl peptidase